MRRLGVLGTMVWDTIHERDPGRDAPIEEWGGIAYALAAFDAVVEGDWELFPILKIGSDMRERADQFLQTLQHVGSVDGVRTVPEPNNRVELYYHEAGRRCERLTGGVPGWSAEELLPLAHACDALYVNFIAGWELDLVAAGILREATPGLVYCDLHSLMLGIGPDGVRVLRPLESWREWLACFDIVQLNEDELLTLAEEWGDPWQLGAEVLGPLTRALLVTRGQEGAVWMATRRFWDDPLASGTGPFANAGDAVLSGRVDGDPGAHDPDPTGCGDVWGITCFASLLSGRSLTASMRRANRVAARNASFRGAGGLATYLRSRSGLLLTEDG
jgi:sugar/nucleoside kinase (ribokinase family)